MREFLLVNAHDIKKNKKYEKMSFMKKTNILPCYSDMYALYVYNKNFSFYELIKLFITGNDVEQIGAMSIIAEQYTDELYNYICSSKDDFTNEKMKFLYNNVIPYYLPLILPKERLVDYDFSDEMSNNIWVKILKEVR